MKSSPVIMAALLLLHQAPLHMSFNFMKPTINSRLTTNLQLNRIFCDLEELTESCIGPDLQLSLVLKINESDLRCKHIKSILKLNVGDTIKGGVIDVGSTDDGRILEISDDQGISISFGQRADLKSNDRPLVDLILAVPRPLRLERILSVISCIGVGNLVLVGAAKVQNDYFGSHLFRRPEEMKICLVEGMSQASSDCMLPNVIVRRNFIKFVMDEMDDLFPMEEYHRIIAHPPSDTINAHPTRVIKLRRDRAKIDGDSDAKHDTDSHDSTVDTSSCATIKKIVVAVGPEGGWEDEEVLLLLSKGFSLVSLGPRILRTDMAVSVLLGLAHDWTDNVV